MIRIRNVIRNLTILAALVLTTSAVAQQDLVTVTLRPNNTNWRWQSYAESISALFANSIRSRVNQGIESREFVEDSATTTLRFSIQIGQSGELRHFSPLTPQNRYHAYLIHRTAGRVVPFRPAPRELPVFYFGGVLTFECRFQPTRWYKKLSFEQPLDSLEQPAFTPMIRTVTANDPALPTYEPLIKDKQQLLVEFKRRIGVTEEITDTSSYTALDVTGRTFFVHVPFDSLGLEAMSDLLLEARLTKALESAGAKITREDYDPIQALLDLEPPPAGEDSATGPDSSAISTVGEEEADSAETALGPEPLQPVPPDHDLAEVSDSTFNEEEADSIETAVGPEPLRSIPPDRNLAEAFASVFNSEFLILSAGLARDSTSDSAVCRVRIYPSEHPTQLKRNFSFKFSHGSRLPDSLGIMLIQRLTAPPAKPAPPPKPKPKVATSPVDTTAAADTTAVTDTTATADTTGTPAVQLPAAATDSSSSTAPSIDSTAAAPATDSTGAQPSAQDTSQAASEVPADTSATDSVAPAPAADTSATPALAADTTTADTP